MATRDNLIPAKLQETPENLEADYLPPPKWDYRYTGEGGDEAVSGLRKPLPPQSPESEIPANRRENLALRSDRKWEEVGPVSNPGENKKKWEEITGKPATAPKRQEQPPEAPTTMQDIVAGLAEPLLAMGSGMVGKAAGDVAGLGAIPLHAAGLIKEEPAAVQEGVRSAMQFVPRTGAGQQVSALLSTPGQIFQQLTHSIVGEKSGNTITGDALKSGAEEALNSLPMLLGIKAPKMAAPIAKGMDWTARRSMASALKVPWPELRKGQGQRAIQTMLDQGINVGEGGLSKVRSGINDLNAKISNLIDNSPATIDGRKVAARLVPVWNKFMRQVNPGLQGGDMAAIQKAYDEFINHPMFNDPKAIPIKTAQEIKQGTHRALSGKYGELKSAEVEAQKGLARGLREEIAKAVPQVKPLNAAESKLLDTLPLLERRVLQSANKNPIGFGIAVAHNPASFMAWMLDRSDMFKSLVGRMLYKGSKGVTGESGPAIGAAISLTPSEQAQERARKRKERAQQLKEE